MIEQNPDRPARKVAIADSLWDAFEEMAAQMGSDRDALINQAMFTFARLNGFVDVQPLSSGLGLPPRAGATGAVLAPAPQREDAGRHLRAADERSSSNSGKLDDDPVRREVAERVLETAAELERLIKGKSDPGLRDADADAGDEGDDDSEGNVRLELIAEGGEQHRIGKGRFIIGRGKHCDLVINSGKVSREHAAIVREGDDHYIEDLGSSNGTWFNKQRIKRRKIEDGDEYFICSEKIKFVAR
ncbi:MAG: FHA domain-containing protein [Myxococcaceae bacterium]